MQSICIQSAFTPVALRLEGRDTEGDASRGYGETIVNTASLVSVTDGVSWKRIRTFAVVVAGPGTFHR